MSAPDPRANPILLGHEAAEHTLLDAMHLGRMHHAWLITGPEGIGKATLAFRFARRLLAGRGASPSVNHTQTQGEGLAGDDSSNLALDPADPVFRRVVAGGHADLLTIERAYDEK